MRRTGTVMRIRKHPTHYTGEVREISGKLRSFSTPISFKVYDEVEFEIEDRSKKAYTLRPHVGVINMKLLHERGKEN